MLSKSLGDSSVTLKNHVAQLNRFNFCDLSCHL